MRFLLAVMAVTVALSLSGAAQNKKPHNVKPSGDTKSEPKSTAPPPKAQSAAASSKDLQRVENSSAKSGHSGQPKKAPRVAGVKSDRSDNNPSINFNGKNGGNAGNRNPGSLKGRLKQKGQGKQR